MLRTNYFQRDDGRRSRSRYLSFKLDPSSLSWLPLPRPQFEIFVYSPRIEGVHLRGGKVARGGMRWSDRREDFRTEVLGLMKAQMVKNAVIVPVGAKGGFVVKRPPPRRPRGAARRGGGLLPHVHPRPARHHRQHRGRRDRAAAATSCATTTTTRTSSSPPTRAPPRSPTSPTRSPASTASGSATRSPPAARPATTTRQMGITARGAWESVKRHFRELGHRRAGGGLHRRRDRRHVGRRVRQRHAALAPHPAGRRVRPPPRLPRPRPRRRARASTSASGCSSCPRSSWDDYDPDLHLRGRRRVLAQREVDPAVAAGARGARRRGGGADARRADPRDPARARRPALERRHRHLREGELRDARRRGRQGQRRGARRRRRAALRA